MAVGGSANGFYFFKTLFLAYVFMLIPLPQRSEQSARC
jgi:hypothetical protein